MRSQSSSSGIAKDKESKYNKNPNKTSSSKGHEKEPREKSSKSSSSKGSHKESPSMDVPAPVVPPIVGKKNSKFPIK